MRFACSRARRSAGNKIATRTVIMPITTSNSISVNAAADNFCLRQTTCRYLGDDDDLRRCGRRSVSVAATNPMITGVPTGSGKNTASALNDIARSQFPLTAIWLTQLFDEETGTAHVMPPQVADANSGSPAR